MIQSEERSGSRWEGESTSDVEELAFYA